MGSIAENNSATVVAAVHAVSEPQGSSKRIESAGALQQIVSSAQSMTEASAGIARLTREQSEALDRVQACIAEADSVSQSSAAQIGELSGTAHPSPSKQTTSTAWSPSSN